MWRLRAACARPARRLAGGAARGTANEASRPSARIAELRATRRRLAEGRAVASAWCRRWARCTRAIWRWSRRRSGRTTASIVTLFVNPTQFAPTEDLAAYPRDEEADRQKLAELGVDLLFAPADGGDVSGRLRHARSSSAGRRRGWRRDFRPHFFAGVATVVAKLLLAGLPDRAFFGEKDFQQLLVVKKLVRDLNIPTEIVGCPTVREADGLALSSRNAYLSADERARAPQLHATLQRDRGASCGAGELRRAALARGRAGARGRGLRRRLSRAAQRRDACAGRGLDDASRSASSPPPGSAGRGSSTTSRSRAGRDRRGRAAAPAAARGGRRGRCRDRAAHPPASDSASPERRAAAATRWRSIFGSSTRWQRWMPSVSRNGRTSRSRCRTCTLPRITQ